MLDLRLFRCRVRSCHRLAPLGPATCHTGVVSPGWRRRVTGSWRSAELVAFTDHAFTSWASGLKPPVGTGSKSPLHPQLQP